MNLFEFFFKMTHPEKKTGWGETTAYFTGECSKAVRHTKTGYRPAEHNVYKIKYKVGYKERTGWYEFNPLPDPDPEEIKGTEIKIRYKKSRPWIFEASDDLDEKVDS